MATIQEILNQQNTGLNVIGGTPRTTLGGIQPLPVTNPVLSGYGYGTGPVVNPLQPTISSGLNDGKRYPNYTQGQTIVPVNPANIPAPVQTQTTSRGTVTNPPRTTNTTTTPVTNTNGLTPAQIAAGYSTIPGAYDPVTGQLKTPATPGSAESIIQSTGTPTGTGYTYQKTADEIAADNLRGSIDAYNLSQFNTDLNPDTIYNNKLKEYQAQIDSINNVYADQLSQARVQGQGRIESRQFAQGRAGQIGSGTGEAGVNAVQDANRQIENSIMIEKANAIASIYGKVREGAAEDLKAKTKAKKEGADALLAELAAAPERKKKRVTDIISQLVSQNVDISEMTEEEKNSYIKGLGITDDEFIKEYNTQLQTRDAAATKAKQEEEKRQLDLKKTEADITKTLSDVANWGKMTEYQKQQIAVDWYKAKNPSEKVGDTKVNNLLAFSDALAQSVDTNGKITPAQYNAFKSQYIAAGIGDAKDFDTNYAQHVYLNPKDKEFAYSPKEYGLKEE
jgi:hypothetical protein